MKDWKDKLLTALHYNQSQLGCILCTVLGKVQDTGPRFDTEAIVTSDGFVMCGFTDSDGRHHYGSFIGSLIDIDRKLTDWSKGLRLNVAQQNELNASIANWIKTDYR